MGKYINELRRKTTNEALSKRAKELVKKWRNAVLPETNGQIKQSPPSSQIILQNTPSQNEDVNLNQLKIKKRPAKEPLDTVNAKRIRVNGGISELEFSDNSNSSFKDVITSIKTEPKRDVIVINSDSNSSLSEKHDPQIDMQIPKKRGRKKGSKNHSNLLDEAESSFSSKLAVSRGNSKVKTTQELIASLQSKNSNAVMNSLSVKPKEDLKEKAAKLTERVSIIDQQLNTNSSRNKHSNRNKFKIEKNERVIESGSVINDKSLLGQNIIKKEQEINIVEDEVVEVKEVKQEKELTEEVKEESQETENINIITSLSVEEALAQLPPIDKSVLFNESEVVRCTCFLKENKTDFSVDDDPEVEQFHRYEFVEDQDCQAKFNLREQYHLENVTDEEVHRLHTTYIPNVNGNYSVGNPKDDIPLQQNGLYMNVVPNVNIENIPKDVKNFQGENFSKYRFSEVKSDRVSGESDCVERTGDVKSLDKSDTKCFREWHEVIETPSYSGEILKILPYVIID